MLSLFLLACVSGEVELGDLRPRGNQADTDTGLDTDTDTASDTGDTDTAQTDALPDCDAWTFGVGLSSYGTPVTAPYIDDVNGCVGDIVTSCGTGTGPDGEIGTEILNVMSVSATEVYPNEWIEFRYTNREDLDGWSVTCTVQGRAISGGEIVEWTDIPIEVRFPVGGGGGDR